jgi:hypothetical protein
MIKTAFLIPKTKKIGKIRQKTHRHPQEIHRRATSRINRTRLFKTLPREFAFRKLQLTSEAE